MTAVSHPFARAAVPRRRFFGWRRRGAIGIVSPSYGTEKVSYGLQPEGFSFHKVSRMPLHRLEKHGTFWHQTPVVLDHPVELVHTFNELPCGLRPFVVSFESELPRYLMDPPPWQLDFGYRLLDSDRCRRILALSEAAARALARRLHERGLGAVASKVGVFRGSIPMTGDIEAPDPSAAETSRPLRVLFVGRDAFRKGLIPTLDALAACIAAGAPIEATIVANVDRDDYTRKDRTVPGSDWLATLQRIPGITHHYQLPNPQVHALMRSHDVLLLPTLDESLGWVVVEAALLGLAVVTTNTFALPELVIDGRTGLLIDLERGIDGRWKGLDLEGSELDDAIARAFERIRTALVRHLTQLADRPDHAAAMGRAGRAHMESLYGLPAAAKQLASIYDAA